MGKFCQFLSGLYAHRTVVAGSYPFTFFFSVGACSYVVAYIGLVKEYLMIIFE